MRDNFLSSSCRKTFRIAVILQPCERILDKAENVKGETIGNGDIACVKVIVTVYLSFLLFCKYAYLECWFGEGMLISLLGYSVCYDHSAGNYQIWQQF